MTYWTVSSANAAATQIISQIKSKEFKDRLNGYEEMLNMFMTLPDTNAPEFARLSPAFEKIMLVDVQPGNKEKALQVLLVFLDRASYLLNPATPSQFFIDLASSIIENGLPGRDSIKVKAIDCLLMIIEITGVELILPVICQGCTNKVYKIATYSVFTLKEVVRQFGINGLPMDTILSQLTIAFEHQIKEVRQEALSLAMELYLWIGDEVTSHLKTLRPAQFKELETSLQSLSKSKTKPQPLRSIRYTRTTGKQQSNNNNVQPSNPATSTSNIPNSANSTPNLTPNSSSSSVTTPTTNNSTNVTNSNNNTSSSSPTNSTNSSPPLQSSPSRMNLSNSKSNLPLPPSLAQQQQYQQQLQAQQQAQQQQQQQQQQSNQNQNKPTDNTINGKLNEFYKMSEEPGWSTRKLAITDIFIPLISNEKISQLNHQDYTKISSTLAKLLGDPNIFVILTCINALELLVKKLSKEIFFNHIIALVPIMLDSFKEKRPQLSDSIHACLNTIIEKQLKINDVLDFILEILLNSKVSKLKFEVLFWFKRLLLVSNNQLYTEELPIIIKALVLNLNDSAKENRDISFINICILYIINGEKDMVKILEENGLDETKLLQIKESSKEINVPSSHWSRKSDGSYSFILPPSNLSGTNPHLFQYTSTFKKSSKLPLPINRNSISDQEQNNNNRAVNISQYRNAIKPNDENEMLKDIQNEINQFNARINLKVKSLIQTVENNTKQSTMISMNNNHQQQQDQQDTKFYETLNMELTKELQNEKEKKKSLLLRVDELEKQLFDQIELNKDSNLEKKKLEEKIDYQNQEIEELNEMLASDEQMREDLMDEIERLKSSTIPVGSMDDPNRYLVEIPKHLLGELSIDEIELFEEVFAENMRIIEESKLLLIRKEKRVNPQFEEETDSDDDM